MQYTFSGIIFFIVFFFGYAPILASSELRSERIYTVSAEVSGGSLSVKKTAVRFGSATYVTDFESFKKIYGGGWSGTVLDVQGKPIAFFSVLDLIPVSCSHGIGKNGKMTGGCTVAESGGVEFDAPFFNNAGKIDIYNNTGKKFASIDVSEHVVCNMNAVCDAPREDSVRCPNECTKQDDIRMQARIAEEWKQSEQKEVKATWIKSAALISGAIIILVTIGMLMAKRYQSLKKYGMFQ